MRVLIAVALIVGCGGNKDPATPPTPSVVDDVSATGLCTTLCTKAIGCTGAGTAEIPACVATCTPSNPQADKVYTMMAMDCPAMLSAIGGGGGAAPAAKSGCAADCRGCAGDGTSCYAVAGGANGIPCDPCCCAPGGGAPVWN